MKLMLFLLIPSTKFPQDNIVLFSRALLAEKRKNLIRFELDISNFLKEQQKSSYPQYLCLHLRTEQIDLKK